MQTSKLLPLFIAIILSGSLPSYSQTDQWIDLDENEEYVARHECSFVQAGDKFILFGGREQSKRLDIYDYKSDTWSTGAQAPKAFNHFQATTYKGLVWVIGAFNKNSFPNEPPESNVWIYHPDLDQWIEGPEIPKSRQRGGAGLVVYNDKFYLVGGNTIGHNGGYVNWFDEYDPYANTWNILENASEKRDHFYAGVIDGKLYAAGGRRSGGKGGVFAPVITTVDVYDFEKSSWSKLTNPLPTPRAAPGTAVYKGKLYLMGGEGEKKGPAYKIVEAYDPITGKWSNKADMNHPRHGTQAICSGKGIFIACGSPNRGGGRQHNMEVYNKNSPKGKPIKASKLSTPDQTDIQLGKTLDITIANTGGNAASFITSVEIKGEDFNLESKASDFLVNPKDSFQLSIKHTGNKAGDEGTVMIYYNGNEKLSFKISSI
ncbi:Kelch repeat-containing protein [Reichenbachiella versicolor]|uniref:Kelch repeat-containing protein n=1 Tax=Reichenbachiella versicolor TaxID=1821036 RepID=UPI000D6E5D54|nr:ring canal kelch [Reichenbachiella versicolor]